MLLAVMTPVKPILTEIIMTVMKQMLKIQARTIFMMTMMPMQTVKMIPLMVMLIHTTVKIIPLMVTLIQTALVLTIPEANDAGTDNVEAADAFG